MFGLMNELKTYSQFSSVYATIMGLVPIVKVRRLVTKHHVFPHIDINVMFKQEVLRVFEFRLLYYKEGYYCVSLVTTARVLLRMSQSTRRCSGVAVAYLLCSWPCSRARAPQVSYLPPLRGQHRCRKLILEPSRNPKERCLSHSLFRYKITFLF